MEGDFSSSVAETRKRTRGDDDEFDSPGLKRFNGGPGLPTQEDSPVSVVSQSDSGNTSNGAEESDEFASPEVVKLRKDILDILDEPEMVAETQELDSVIKSFEEEILQPKTAQVTSFPGEPQPDLGFLLGASDDELGLPPSSTTVAGEESKTQTEPANEGAVHAFDDMAGFEDVLPVYDPFELDIVDVLAEGDDFGLFDDVNGSDLAWRPESLPAL